MTYERGNGQQNMIQATSRRTVTPAARHACPAADYNTSQLVTKLRSRGSANAPHLRAPSSDLMQDAYKNMPQKNSRQAANVHEMSPVLDNKYSPYSDVNVTAVKKAQAQRANAQKQNVQQNIRNASQANGHAKTAQPRASAPSDRNRQPQTSAVQRQERERKAAPTRATGASRQPAPREVKFRHTAPSAQLAESGPREVAFKSVPFPKLVFMILMFAVIVFLMIHSVVQNFEYQNEIAELQTKLDTLNKQADSLRLDLEKRDDLAEIERRAEEIGMIKSNSIEEKYISLGNSDIIENFGTDKDEYGSFTTMLSAVSRRLSKFFSGQ